MVRIAHLLILERLSTVLHGDVRRITASEKMSYSVICMLQLHGRNNSVTGQLIPDPGTGQAQGLVSGNRIVWVNLKICRSKLFFDVTLICTKCSKLII